MLETEQLKCVRSLAGVNPESGGASTRRVVVQEHELLEGVFDAVSRSCTVFGNTRGRSVPRV